MSPDHRGLSSGVLLIAAGIGIFILCSIVQGIGGSHMFTMQYLRPDSALLNLLMQVTWWPGWVATVGLIGTGVFRTLDG